MTDIPGNTSTTAAVTVGSTTSGTLDAAGDHDWYRITLSAGQSITVTINGVTLEDPYLYIRDSAGNLLYQNDDISSGINRNSQLSFTATYSGTYYIDVGAFNEAYTGDYQVVVATYSPPPLATNDQIADQLVNGYWGGASESHHFNVTQGGTITVNMTMLNAGEQTLARAALAEWSDIIGVSFQEVSTGGQIQFDNREDPNDPGPIAATDANWSFDITSSAHVQISTSWVNTYGTGLNSYSFQTYLHEIGHALGLGHAGNYNGDAAYPYDALFQNDAWSTSIMSYVRQRDNTSFAGQGFSEDYAVTPMLADILAMQQLYGLSTTTRTGDTTYGYNSNAGGIYNASLYPNVAYTIFDSGGTDTLDFSGSSFDQLLNLNPETFSNVSGNTGNLTIARGVVIEDAIGGAGNDTIIGNAANNVLNGGAGTDTVDYSQETGSGGVYVNLGDGAVYGQSGLVVDAHQARDTYGNIDTLISIERVITGAGNDSVLGSGAADYTDTGAGDDFLNGGAGADTLIGGSGNDAYAFNSYEGDAIVELPDGGIDEVRTFTPSFSLAGIANVENLRGFSSSGQTLVGNELGNRVTGFTGDDTLSGGAGVDTLTGDGGIDTFKDTSAGLNGDTITDLVSGEKIIITDATLAGFTFSLSGNTLSWSGGSLTLANLAPGRFIAGAAAGGGVELRYEQHDPAHDFNGDGRSDIALRHDSGLLTDWLGQGNGSFASNQGIGAYRLDLSWHVIGTGDFNGDGRDDLLLRHDTGLMTDWLGQPNGTFVSNQGIAAYRLDLSWHVVGTCDINGDGRDDLILRHDTGMLTEWLGQANGTFTSNQAIATYRLDPSWHVVGTGDFNGDGRDDLVLRHDTGLLTDWLGQANGGFTSNQSIAAFRLDPAWHVIDTGDFNGDGRDDLLLRHDNGTMTDWLGLPNGSFASNHAVASYGLDTAWHEQPQHSEWLV